MARPKTPDPPGANRAIDQSREVILKLTRELDGLAAENTRLHRELKAAYAEEDRLREMAGQLNALHLKSFDHRRECLGRCGHLEAENARLGAEVERLWAELHSVKAGRKDVLEMLETARDQIDELNGELAERRNERLAGAPTRRDKPTQSG